MIDKSEKKQLEKHLVMVITRNFDDLV